LRFYRLLLHLASRRSGGEEMCLDFSSACAAPGAGEMALF
jgi:hypothetical protein